MTITEISLRCYNALDDLECIGIDLSNNAYKFKFNTSLKRVCAQCCYNQENDFTIEFNPMYVESVDVDELYDTIVHELLHSAPNCYNHGTEWKRLADIANSKLLTNVTRCYKGTNFNPYRYYVKCPTCNKVVYKSATKSPTWKNIYMGNTRRFHCNVCKCYDLIAFEED